MTDDLEDAIDGFVELEDELATGGAAGTYHEGTVSGGSKVPVSEVPDGYPVEFDTDHALRLDVETEDSTALSVYLPWPEPGSEADAVPRLLDALGLDVDEFANIYGERVALEPVEEWHRVDVDGSPPGTNDGRDGSVDAGSSLNVGESDAAPFDEATPSADTSLESTDDASLAAFLVPAVAVVMGLGWLFGGTSGVVFTVALVLFWLSVLAIPASLAYSASVTSGRGGWNPRPLVWGALGAVPVLNVPVGGAYLLEWVARGRPVRERPATSLWGVVVATLLSGVPLGHLFVVGLESAFQGPLGTVAGTAWLYAVVLVPLTIYLDAGHVSEAGDWDPVRPLWVVAALPVAVVFSGWLVGFPYLVKRYVEGG